MIFKLKGVGLDLTNLDYSPDSNQNEYYYLHTNLSSGNDSLICDYIKKLSSNEISKVPLVTTTNFLDEVEIALMGHLAEFSKTSLELLLINSKCDIDKYQETLAKLEDSGIVKNFGISMPSGIKELTKTYELYKSLGITCKYVSLNISPYSFNYDIVKYCKENELMIVGFNPFGGYLTAPTLITSFTVPYLLEFSASYCDIVFLSSRDLYNSIIDKNYLENLIDREYEDSKYEITSNIDKIYKPVEKLVSTSFKFMDGSVLPYDNPSLVYFNPDTIETTFGKNVLPEIKNISPTEEGTLEYEVYEYYKTLHYPEDGNEKDFFGILRFQVHRLFELKFKDMDTTITNIGDRIVLFNATKRTFIDGGWFKKDKLIEDIHNYLLYFYKGTFVFKEIKTDPETPKDLNIEDINIIK